MDMKSDRFNLSSASPIEPGVVRASAAKRPKTSSPEIHDALRRLQQWAAKRSPTGLTREQAASIASREPHYLSYLFRREMGKTFINWRREHRTSVAIAALQEGKYSINEIVTLVGYRSRRSLERAVKKVAGRTAGSFKREQRIEHGSASTPRKECT